MQQPNEDLSIEQPDFTQYIWIEERWGWVTRTNFKFDLIPSRLTIHVSFLIVFLLRRNSCSFDKSLFLYSNGNYFR